MNQSPLSRGSPYPTPSMVPRVSLPDHKDNSPFIGLKRPANPCHGISLENIRCILLIKARKAVKRPTRQDPPNKLTKLAMGNEMAPDLDCICILILLVHLPGSVLNAYNTSFTFLPTMSKYMTTVLGSTGKQALLNACSRTVPSSRTTQGPVSGEILISYLSSFQREGG